MTRISLLNALALASASSALQIPLQLPFSTPWTPKVVQVDDSGDDLPLIDSEKLQERIHSLALQKRAEVLYSIAELGTEEYGHPTRVIGSQGT